MKLTRRGIWLAALSAVVGTLAVTAVSSAHDKFFKTRVSISLAKAPRADVASGVVDAHKDRCRSGRTVVLFEEGKPGVTGTFIEIGRTTTDANGAWSVPIQNGIKKGLRYHAQAKAERLRNTRGHKHICKAKFSPDVVGS